MMTYVFAACSAAFFLAFAFVAAMVGDEHTARFVVLFLFCAGVSQFLAQGNTKLAYYLADTFICAALLSALAILLSLVF